MDPMIAALLRPEAYDHPVETVELLETHISWILLTGPYAYKIKKPVDLGFVDFHTAERRRWFCREELRLNRRLAPDLYISLATIHGPPAEARFHGRGPAIEVAVKMHQFCGDALLSERLERAAPPSAGLFEDLAVRLASFHGRAAVAAADTPFGTAEAVLAPALANLEALRRCSAAQAALPDLGAWTRSEHRRLRDTFQARRREGRIRECHGDLHLGNMALHDGRIEVFDCLEFSPQLRWIDVISDMAFLVMDLQRLGRRRLAALVLDRWLGFSGDYTGLRTWHWYRVYRALVRAKVNALRLEQKEVGALERADRQDQLGVYLDLAMATTRADRPALVITHGVSGSGKSHVSRALCRRLGWLQIRSDVERKRLFGQWGEPWPRPLSGDPYRTEVGTHLYGERLPACARAALEGGFSVVVDATFLTREARQRMRRLADAGGWRFLILDFRTGNDLALRRIEERRRRGGDPSDADEAVLRGQILSREPLSQAEQGSSLPVEAAGGAGRSGLEGRSEDGAAERLAQTLLERLGQP